jgi:hypothetical protein
MNISQVEHDNDVSGILEAHIFTHDVVLPETIDQKLDYLHVLKSGDEKNQLLLGKYTSLSLCALSIMPALVLTLINQFIPVHVFLLILSYITAGCLGFTFFFMIFDPEFEEVKTHESDFPKFNWIKSFLMKRKIFKKREQEYLIYSQRLGEFFKEYLAGIDTKISSYQEMIASLNHEDSINHEKEKENKQAFIKGFNDLKTSFEDFKNNPFFFNFNANLNINVRGDIMKNKKAFILSIENMENQIKYQDLLLSQLQDSQKNINLKNLL